MPANDMPMYRIRFHGRGGQGMKTASRILGTAFFLEAYEVQDAPRYGAERRGAPIFAYVRASRETIQERGIIGRPDLVVVADDTLVAVPAAGVMQGVDGHTVMLINSHEAENTWRNRLNLTGPLLVLPSVETVADRAEAPYVGAICAGAAARLIGAISKDCLQRAIREELAEFDKQVLAENLRKASEAFELMAEHSGCVKQAGAISARRYHRPEWVHLPLDDARISAPTIHATATSVQVDTGLWRTLRPVVDYDRCNRCWWVCSSFCPDGAISVSKENTPLIDYQHCKGCMICVAQCPPHAIEAIPESAAQTQDQSGARA